MKILIIYHISHQIVLMKSLCEQINKVGLYADAFDINSLIFMSPKGHKKPIPLAIYKLLIKIPFVRHYAKKLLYKKLILNIAKGYDIIDIQSLFNKFYLTIVSELHTKKKIKAQLWGSDFYRTTPEKLKWQNIVFRYVDIIQVSTQQMADDFTTIHPKLKEKVRVGTFGNQHLDDLNYLFEHPDKEDLSFLNHDYIGKTIITCGYNGGEKQQHLEIIKALSSLPPNIKKELFVIFPMTYLAQKNYLDEIYNVLKNTDINYQVITNRLTEEQVLSLRIITDIAINIQTSDVLASSLQEHLYCGNILIVGEWLPYSIYDENGIFYIKTSLPSLSQNINEAIYNKKALKDYCKTNPQKLYDITSWNVTTNQWKRIYEEIYSI